MSAVRAAATTLAVALIALAFAPAAHAGSFRISQCNAVVDGGLSARAYQESLWSVWNGWPASHCGAAGGWLRFATPNYRLIQNSTLTARFALPASMPGTSMATAWLDWRSMPQAASTNPAYAIIAAGGARIIEAPSGSGTPVGSADRRSLPSGSRTLDFVTWCSPVNGPGWCNWPGHLFELRGMTVELEEHGEPAAAARGPLTEPGERSGVQSLEVHVADADSGVRRVAVTLGGVRVAGVDAGASCRDDALPPCPQALRRIVDVDTARVPDGPMRLHVVVTDAAGNTRTHDAGTVLVHNQPPPPVVVPPGTPGPPPPGPYPQPPGSPGAPFPPNPLAGRGHVPNGRNADEHARVRAWLEYRHVRRSMVTAPRLLRIRIRGRVTNSEGRPVRGAALVLLERFGGRRWKVGTGVRTRRDGRFTAFTRVGPSRALRFVYYPFGDSPRGIRSRVLFRAVG